MKWRAVVLLGAWGLAQVSGASPDLKTEQDQDSVHWRSFRKGTMAASSREMLLPKELVQLIESDFVAIYRAQNKDTPLSDQKIRAAISRELLELRLWLKPESGNALESGVQFAPPRGGGVLDLRDYVTGRFGRFGLGLELSVPEGPSIKDLRVYFLSAGRQRTIDRDELGSGCNRFMDLSRFFIDQWQGKTIDLFSKDQRYLSVIAGTYIFVLMQPPKLWLAGITLTDSRYPQHLCSLIKQSVD